MNLAQDLGLSSPLLLLTGAAALVLLLSVARRPSASAGGARTSGAHLAAIALLALGVSASLLWTTTESTQLFGGALVRDALGAVFGVVVLLGAALGIVLAQAYLDEHELAHGEFIALVLLCSVGMLMVVMAGDLMTLFIGIEIMSLAAYVLAGYRRALRQAQEAALKYFIYGAFASGFVIFGIALLYGEAGRVLGTPALSLTAVRAMSTAGLGSTGWIGVGMILGGFAFKVAAVPFHMWAPDVYEGAPTPATAFMAVGVKAAAFAGLCRFAGAALQVRGDGVVRTLEIVAVSTLVVGNLLAVRQTQIKRLLAYSSIAHAGYALMGLVAFVVKPASGGIEAIAYYLLAYTAMTLGAFAVVLAFERREDRRLDLATDRFAGIAHRYPGMGLALALFMFSLTGIPPTAGFFGKLSLFSAAVDAGRVELVIVAALASAVGAYYYLRVVVIAYMKAEESAERRVVSPWLTAGLWACAVLTLVIGLAPQPYMAAAKRAVAAWIG